MIWGLREHDLRPWEGDLSFERANLSYEIVVLGPELADLTPI